jgi:drug/metabolite transporter (DMT)-like permease
MKLAFLQIIIVALSFGIYPLLVRASSTNEVTSAFWLTIFSLLPLSVLLLFGGVQLPNTANMIRLGIGGICMGVGFVGLVFVSLNKSIPISISMPAIDSLMLTVLVLGGIFFFREQLLTRQIIGILLVLPVFILLRPE